MPKSQRVSFIFIGLLVGAALTIGGEVWMTSLKNDKTAITLEKCTSVANLVEVKEQNPAQRALRIADCMAGNGYLFTGAKPESSCYAENPIQVQVKHILPSCYQAQHNLFGLPK